LLPLGCEAAPLELAPGCIRLTALIFLGLMRSPTGASSLATVVWLPIMQVRDCGERFCGEGIYPRWAAKRPLEQAPGCIRYIALILYGPAAQSSGSKLPGHACPDV